MLRIALAQINTTVGDLVGNARKITEYIIRARRMSAQVVVFPELAIPGYPPEDLLLKKYFIRDNLKALRSIIPATANITAIVGFVDADKKGNLYNAAAVIYNKQLKGIYHKADLPNYGVFDEKRYFVSGKIGAHGQRPLLFKFGETLLGVSICEDIWTKDGICHQQALAGAQILINISSSPYYAGKGKIREKIMIDQARRNKAYVCYANLVGGQDELVFDGASLIVDPKGKIIAAGKQFAEDLVVADLDIGEVEAGLVPARLLKRAITRFAPTKVIITSKPIEQGRLPIKGSVPKPLNPTEEIYRALVLGTRDYIRKNGFKKAVIGLSGGIDSSLTAIIACDAVGKENVVGVSMPSRYTSPGTRSDARILAENLGIKFYEIPIETVFKSYLEILHDPFVGQKPDLAEENLQARVRGNILMALSNKFGWLVLTTGNKSEVAVGYCTLYGDMAGGFAVLKDVPKTKVYELARFRNDFDLSVGATGRSPLPLIPQSVFDRAPTAELRENQKDQDSLPAYEVLDPIIERYVELDQDLNGASRNLSLPQVHKIDLDVIKKVVNLVDKAEYKRRQSPPGVKITPKAFGKDRRMPITNRYCPY